jgi:regulator of protease activity HflC (stomatin/prohibitin superfamily)
MSPLKIGLLAGAALVGLIVVRSTATLVTPGHEGIKVNYYGTDKGVSNLPLVTGMVWSNPFTTNVLVFPTFVQTTQWVGPESMVFNSKEGMVFMAEVSLSYQIEATKVPEFYVKFRTDRMETFTNGFLHNIARDAFNEIASTYDADELYTKKDELMPKVLARINAETNKFGVNLIQLGYIGALHAPESVTNAILAKVAAIQNAQRTENELQSAKAEAAKVVAEAEGEATAAQIRATGLAKANQTLAATITPTLIQWKQVEVSAQWAQKWNGELPTYSGQLPTFFMQGASSGPAK